MAKKSKIVANERRKQVVARYAERRAELKEAIRTASTPEERDAAVRALNRLPRDASPVRVRNRDQVDGRPRGYVRKVGLSRINLRTLAHRGELPGITKSSW
jgi:small subunit ribosomal protein S14